MINYIRSLLETVKFSSYLKPTNEKVEEYLRSRAIDPNIFEHYSFKGNVEGLTTENAIVIPLRLDCGFLFGVQIRDIENKQFRTLTFKSLDKSNQKYSKFWLHSDYDENRETIVCESIFDALSMKMLFPEYNVASSLGASLPPGLISILKYPIICFDRDLAGIKGALGSSRKFKIALLDNVAKDPNELLVKYGQSAKNYIKIVSGIEGAIILRKLMGYRNGRI